MMWRMEACISLSMVFVVGGSKTKAYIYAIKGGEQEEVVFQLWRKVWIQLLWKSAREKVWGSVRKCEAKCGSVRFVIAYHGNSVRLHLIVEMTSYCRLLNKFHRSRKSQEEMRSRQICWVAGAQSRCFWLFFGFLERHSKKGWPRQRPERPSKSGRRPHKPTVAAYNHTISTSYSLFCILHAMLCYCHSYWSRRSSGT